MIQRFLPSAVLLILFFQLDSHAVRVGAEEELIRVQLSSEPTQYDPLYMEDGTALRIAANVIGTPYEYDGYGKIRKGLASELKMEPDRRTYILKFKKNLRWSDGKIFQADQFVAAIRRLSSESVRSALSGLFPEFDLGQIKTIDAQTVRMVLKQPDPHLEKWLTLPPFAPLREDLLESYGKRNPVVPTLGPYQVAEYKREDYLLLKKNPWFHEKDAVEIPAIKIRFLKDESSSLALLKNGDLDILFRVPVMQLEQIRKVVEVSEFPVEAVTYLGLNTRKKPFQDARNRRMFLEAVLSKNVELAKILNTGEMPAGSFLPPILMPSSLKKQMESPFIGSSSDEKLEFSVQSDGGSRNETLLQFVQNGLKEKLGWKMKINTMDWKAHYAKLKSDGDEVFRFGWQNPVSDPFVMYQVLESKSPNNFTGWSNPEYDRMVEALKRETQTSKKVVLIGKIEKILRQEAPVVPLLHQVLRLAHSKRVQRFRANPFGVVLFRELRLAQKIGLKIKRKSFLCARAFPGS